jgi:multidrug resistance efflux pump
VLDRHRTGHGKRTRHLERGEDLSTIASGTVGQVLVKNAEPVEYGQPLIVVD